ncbi:MAG: F0F1 ATP synthase subunit A, partial [Burkholderiales bacterium]
MANEHSPLHQFEVHPIFKLAIGSVDISFTNASLFMVLASVLVVSFLSMTTKRRLLVPNRWQNMAELCYQFVGNIVKENVGNEGKKYFPFIFSLFMFVLFANLLGMLPYSFTITSHIVVTFALAIVTFIGITAIGFMRHGLHYLNFFLPKGTPWWLAP